jgi:hypothetical protein
MLNLVYVSGKGAGNPKGKCSEGGEPAGCAGATDEYFSPDTVAVKYN